MSSVSVCVESLKAEDAAAALAVIVEGLAERWGVYEPCFNPDLEDFPASYRDSFLLIAKQGHAVVGTGVLQPIGPESAQIVRMSVVKTWRRSGIGSLMLAGLLGIAREQGFKRITLETTASWQSAVEFYQSRGFVPTHQHDGNQHFLLTLSEA